MLTNKPIQFSHHIWFCSPIRNEDTQLYTSKGEKQMKKFNKVLALGMAGSMALSMAACGGSSSSASTGTDGSSTSTAAPTAAPSMTSSP